MKPVLVLGYGNTLRADDGVGPAVAARLAGQFPALDVRTLHQLTPENAADAAEAELVIFVDADCDNEPGAVTVRPVVPELESLTSLNHTLTPGAVLGLAKQLYDRRPEGLLVTVGAASFEFGEGLTGPVQAAVPEVLERIQAVCGARQSFESSGAGTGHRGNSAGNPDRTPEYTT